jgi:hypothetical protein
MTVWLKYDKDDRIVCLEDPEECHPKCRKCGAVLRMDDAGAPADVDEEGSIWNGWCPTHGVQKVQWEHTEDEGYKDWQDADLCPWCGGDMTPEGTCDYCNEEAGEPEVASGV